MVSVCMVTLKTTVVGECYKTERSTDFSNQVAEHRVAELRLEPGALGRHDAAGPRMPPTKLTRLLVRESSMPNTGDRTCCCSSDTSSESIRPLVVASL